MSKLHLVATRSASIALALASLLAGCGGDPAATPDGAVLASVEDLRKDHVGDFLRAVTSPEDLAEMRKSWADSSRETPDQATVAQFEETMAKLTASGAVDDLFAELEPALPGLRQQWAGVTGMLPMLASGAASQGGLESDEAQQAFASLASKLAAVDVADPKKIRSALEVVTKGARKLDLDTLQDLQGLDFDQLLDRADVVFGVTKDVLAIYDLSLDETLSSVAARVVSEEGDQATVEVGSDLFGGGPQTMTVTMARTDGRWFPQQ